MTLTTILDTVPGLSTVGTSFDFGQWNVKVGSPWEWSCGPIIHHDTRSLVDLNRNAGSWQKRKLTSC